MKSVSVKKINVRQRFIKVAVIFFKIFRDFSREYSLIKKHGYAHTQQIMKPAHERRARQLYSIAISMGGVLIKLCQFFSARRDIFPDSYIKILSSLQDDVPAVPFNEIESVLLGEYGDYRKNFKYIATEPLASASLGQVHRAMLHDGTEVVLKILKPDIERIIDTDFAILYHVFKLLSNFKVIQERADIFNLLDEFIKVTGDELNFRREAVIAGEFRKFVSSFDYVKVPSVYTEYSTQKVIVMEYLTGDKVNEIVKWSSRNNDPVLLSRRIISLYLEQLLNFGIIHFDPHPGNLLVTQNSCFILVDFGMSGIINDKMREGLMRAIRAFIERDYRTILDVLDDLGFIRKGVNRYSLLNVTEYFFDKILSAIKFDRESIQTMDLSPIRDELIEIIYSQPFNIPYEWAYIGKTIGVLAGLTATLNPELKIYDELKPYVDKYLSRNLISVAEEMYDYMKSNFSLILRFPSRIDSFFGNIERGNYKFKVDYTEMIDKIDEVKVFVIRLLSLVMSVVAYVSSFIFWNADKRDIAIMFIPLGTLALGLSMFYKKRSLRERLKKYF